VLLDVIEGFLVFLEEPPRFELAGLSIDEEVTNLGFRLDGCPKSGPNLSAMMPSRGSRKSNFAMMTMG
jgi:hypothetical protein